MTVWPGLRTTWEKIHTIGCLHMGISVRDGYFPDDQNARKSPAFTQFQELVCSICIRFSNKSFLLFDGPGKRPLHCFILFLASLGNKTGQESMTSLLEEFLVDWKNWQASSLLAYNSWKLFPSGSTKIFALCWYFVILADLCIRW